MLLLAVVFDWWVVIHGVVPAVVPPGGGTILRVEGSGFVAPVRVLLDFGNGDEQETYVISAVESQYVEFVVPPVAIVPPAQSRNAHVTVIARAGFPDEQRTTSDATVRFQNESLVPVIETVSPNRGSMAGGTLITIFGDAFEYPVQVKVGDVEARVFNANFNTIVVEVPAAGAPGPARITVRNINSGTETHYDGFTYSAPARVDAIAPDAGPVAGGTRVVITGSGFRAPVAVTIAGVAATVLSVRDHEIVAVTNSAPTSVSGPVEVVNVDAGEVVTGPTFRYVAGRRRAVGAATVSP